MEELKHPDVAAIFERLLRELGISGNQLAVALGTSQQAISNYTSGRNKPGREIMAAIVQRYPAINAAWLLTGEGDPFPEGRYNEKPATSLAHGRAHGEARATTHPTVQPTDKELANGAANGPAMREGFPPVPGTATPEQADFVGRLIHRLETELADAKAREEQQSRLIEQLLGKSPASAHAATPAEPATPISLRPTACIDAKIIPMHPVEVETEEEVLAA
jgi:transcriptional regulator with XRE-family HTH domain